MRGLVRSASSWLSGLLTPPVCTVCEAVVADGHDLCPNCLLSAKPFALDEQLRVYRKVARTLSVRSLFPYTMAVRSLLRDVKYGAFPYAAERLLAQSLEQLQESAEDSVLIPVPLHTVRLRERGYNQAERIARIVAKAWGCTVCTDAVYRTRSNQKQARLARSERSANAEGLFALKSPESIRGRRVVIVDDVVTTGATLFSVVESLDVARPESIQAFCYARAQGAGDSDYEWELKK